MTGGEAGRRTSQSLLLRLDQPMLPRCGSTQDLCRDLARRGAPEGAVVWAEEQEAGRGRGDRRWHSPAGSGLYLSFILRPRCDRALWPSLTALTALAMAEALESLASPLDWRAAVKWPNDIYGRRGKLAGVLAETAESAVLIGVGVNLRQTPEGFPPPLRNSASSLRMEGIPRIPSGMELAGCFNQHLTRAYGRFQNGDHGFLREGLLHRFFLRGAWVRVEHSGDPVEGRAVDLGPQGELILETSAGRISLFGGEIACVRRTSRDEE